jgi:hypothetical protein
MNELHPLTLKAQTADLTADQRRAALQGIEEARAPLLKQLAILEAIEMGHRAALEAEGASA